FDGTTLYYLSDSNDVLYRLNPNNGAVLGQTALPAGTYDGLASLRGLVYAIETNNDRILVIDPTAGTVVRTIDARAANPGKSFSGGLGAITNPDAIIATTTTQEVLLLNPTTGAAISSFTVTGTSAQDLGAAAI